MFKSSGQRKFLFAMDKDKKNGQDPQEIHSQKSQASSIPTSHPSQMTTPPPTFSAGVLGQSTRFHPPVSSQIHPTSNPGLNLPKEAKLVPALPGIPRFAKMRKYLK